MSYITIQLPKEFVEEFIDPLIKDKKNGFSSRARFVIDGVKLLSKQVLDGKIENKIQEGSVQ